MFIEMTQCSIVETHIDLKSFFEYNKTAKKTRHETMFEYLYEIRPQNYNNLPMKSLKRVNNLSGLQNLSV